MPTSRTSTRPIRYWGKYYHLYDHVDSEAPRFLEFERWWGGFYLYNDEEIRWIVNNLFVGNKLSAGEAELGPGRFFDLKSIKSPIIVFASMGDNITPPQQAFNWISDVYSSSEEIKANGQTIVGLLHEDIGHLGIFVSGKVAKKEHAQIVELLKYIQQLPPGLYGMQIKETTTRAGGEVEYEVTLTERDLEDLKKLQKFDRTDEKPFEAVAALSELTERAYELLARPLVRQLIPEWAGKISRDLHPLRVQRWIFSDRNPWLAALPAWAALARSTRQPRGPDNDLAKLEHLGSAWLSAGLDLYRDLRDAVAEAAFFQLYGSMMSLAMADQQQAIRRAARFDPRGIPAVRQVLDTIEAGSPIEGIMRIGLLITKAGGGRRKLAQMERVRELLSPSHMLDGVTEDELRRLLHEETIVVEFEPDRAKRALPKLLRSRADRRAAHALLDALETTAPRRSPAFALDRAAPAPATARGDAQAHHGGDAAAQAPAAGRGLRAGSNSTTMQHHTNHVFEEIAVGESASASHTVTANDVEALAFAAGDVEGAHLERAPQSMDQPCVQGAAAIAMIAGLIGRRLPGPGAEIRGTTFGYGGLIRVGDTLSATVTARAKHPAEGLVDFDCRCVNQRGDVLAAGSAAVHAPTQRFAYTELATPEVVLRHNDGFAKLLRAAEALEPVRCAVVHPCDPTSLRGAIEAARRHLIVPVLVGPEAKIRTVAAAEGIDIGAYRLVSTEHSHAAAARAVELVHAGEAEALMKGSLHTDELMAEVVATAGGLRTARRITHVFVIDVPTYPRLLMVTDAAVNIDPDLATKVDICQNAIDLAHVLGIACPKVAILSAVETVNPKIPGTIDAAALCKMADRGQITGGVLDGPLAFDNAVSKEAARTKGIVSPVAGEADILVVPDLEAGNMLAKQLQYLGGADAAGIVLGARVPIVLTSRADNVRARLASTAVLKLVAHARRGRVGVGP